MLHNLPTLPSPLRSLNGFAVGGVTHLTEPVWANLMEFLGDDFYKRKREREVYSRHPGTNAPVTDRAKDLASDTYDATMDYGNTAFSYVADTAAKLMNTAQDYASQAYNTVAGTANATLNTARDTAGSAYNSAANTASNIGGTARDYTTHTAGATPGDYATRPIGGGQYVQPSTTTTTTGLGNEFNKGATTGKYYSGNAGTQAGHRS